MNPENHGASSRAKTLSAPGRGGKGSGGARDVCCHPAEEDDMRRRGGGWETTGVAGAARSGRGPPHEEGGAGDGAQEPPIEKHRDRMWGLE
jgi:hypothetical protein